MKNLILFHGWGANGSVWKKQASAFRARLRVETPTIPAWDPAWLGAYLHNFSLPDCLLVGWSLGGMLLLEALASQPAPVGGLVLVGVAPVFCSQPDHPWGQPPVAVRAMRRALKSNQSQVLEDFARNCLSSEEVAFQDEVPRLFTEANTSHLATGLDYLLHQDLRPLLAKLTTPCTIIQGLLDGIVPPEQARLLNNQLPGSSLRLLPAAGHVPFWTQTLRFTSIIEGIIERGTGL